VGVRGPQRGGGRLGAAESVRVPGHRVVVAALRRAGQRPPVDGRPFGGQGRAGHRLAGQRVPEPEPGVDHEQAPLDQPPDRRLGVGAADLGQVVHHDPVAEQRDRAGHPADRRVLAGQPVEDQRGEVARQRGAGQCRQAAVAVGGQQFGQPERVAVGALVRGPDHVGRRHPVEVGGDQRADLGGGQRPEVAADAARGAGEPAQRAGGQPRVRTLVRRPAGHHEQRRQRHCAGEVGDEREALGVEVVQVLDDQYPWPVAEQRPDHVLRDP
jgi:hypothetical protein